MPKYRYKLQTENKAKIVSKLSKEKIPYWQLGEALGCHENTISRMLRNPSDEQTARLLQVIDEIASSVEV